MGEMRSSQEGTFSTWVILNSESYHRAEERPSKKIAGGVRVVGADTRQEKGPAWKIGAYEKRNNPTLDSDTALHGCLSLVWRCHS